MAWFVSAISSEQCKPNSLLACAAIVHTEAASRPKPLPPTLACGQFPRRAVAEGIPRCDYEREGCPVLPKRKPSDRSVFCSYDIVPCLLIQLHERGECC